MDTPTTTKSSPEVNISNQTPVQKRVSVTKVILLLTTGIAISAASAAGGYFLGKDARKGAINQEVQLVTEEKVTSPEPTEEVVDYYVYDGNVYQIYSSGQEKLILNKEDFKEDPYLGGRNKISSGDFKFTSVAASPNNKNLLISAYTGLGMHVIYISSPDGKNMKYIGVTDDAKWSSDGRYIAYTSRPADAGPLQIFNAYDTTTNKEIDLRKIAIEKLNYKYLGFEVFEWFNWGENSLIVKYTKYNNEADMPLGFSLLEEGGLIIKVETQ